MSRMAVTPCCGVVSEPSSRTLRAAYRSALRLGICPLCKLDLTAPLNGDDLNQARAKIWFHTNAYMPGSGSRIWQWSDDEALLFREIMAEYHDDEIDPEWDKWVALEPYTGTLAVVIPVGDSASVLDVKRAGGWYNDPGWRVPLSGKVVDQPDTPREINLIEMLRARGYRILPSVALAEKYRARWVV